jgi:hypothetical protein
MKPTINGSCHCGKVRFSCELDLAAATYRCNCSICSRARYWLAVVPAPQFRLLAGAEELSDYRFGSGSIHHRFCRTCGIKTFGEGDHPAFGGRFYGVNVGCLDLSPEVLAELPVTFSDGRHDAQQSAPAITGYL